MTRYDIWVARSNGERIGIIDRFVSLRYERELNGTGMALHQGDNRMPLTLTLARSDFTLPMGRDTVLEVWRDGMLATETVWLVQRIKKLLTSQGQSLVEIGAVPAITILHWRNVAYASSAAETQVNAPADDVMSDIVEQNLAGGASPERRIADYLTTEAHQGRAPTIEKGFARWTVLRVLQDIANHSMQAGVPLYFDVIYDGSMPLRFRTYVHVRGTDRSASVTLAPRFGTLANVERTIDYDDEVTSVYALGQGALTERIAVEVIDQARIDQSVFGRRERSIDARHLSSRRELTAQAKAALAAGRPREDFQASVVNRPHMAYGKHWHWGDLVTAEYDGELFVCRVDSVHIDVDASGRETIRATLRHASARLRSSDTSTDVRSEETEHIYHQVHGAHLPDHGVVMVPDGGLLQVPMEYYVGGVLAVGVGAKVIQVG